MAFPESTGKVFPAYGVGGTWVVPTNLNLSIANRPLWSGVHNIALEKPIVRSIQNRKPARPIITVTASSPDMATGT